mmetsp:Transcript_14031/g.17004  ORF Transcript_14031/g.17004 Transcript_14031/m.17004 type:complete len:247 (-) Transcript_14031:660-1400(-)
MVVMEPVIGTSKTSAAWMLKCVTTVIYWRLGFGDYGTPLEEYATTELRDGKLKAQGTLRKISTMRAYPKKGYVQVEYETDTDLVGERFMMVGDSIGYKRVADFIEMRIEGVGERGDQDGGGEGRHLPQNMVAKEEASLSIHLAFRTAAWLYADVYGEWKTHEMYLDKNSSMYGAKGTERVLAFKKDFLTGFPAYTLEGPMYIDVESRTVTTAFRCLLAGKIGKGVEIVTWNKGGSKVAKVDAIRYG